MKKTQTEKINLMIATLIHLKGNGCSIKHSCIFLIIRSVGTLSEYSESLISFKAKSWEIDNFVIFHKIKDTTSH